MQSGPENNVLCLRTAACRAPLQQAQERLQARQARPDNERVTDDVQNALRAELAHLGASTAQLTSQVRSHEV